MAILGILTHSVFQISNSSIQYTKHRRQTSHAHKFLCFNCFLCHCFSNSVVAKLKKRFKNKQMDKIENMVEVLTTNLHRMTFVEMKNLAIEDERIQRQSLCKAEQIRPCQMFATKVITAQALRQNHSNI